MAHNVKFDYDSYTDKLIVDANGERNVFLLNDKRGKLFKYILQAIDDLDSGSASINADWDEDDPTSKSYIKNRSSYIDRTYSESAGFSFKSGAGSTEISLPRKIQKDYLYNISIDYETYVGLKFIPGTDLDGNTFYYCGNPKLDSSLNTLGEAEYPFFVKVPVDPETGIEDKLYFFHDSVGEYDVNIVNSGALVAEVPVQREYTFDGEVRKDFFTYPSTTLPESLNVILNYVKRSLPLVSASDGRLFFYGNSDLVKNYLTLKGIDSSVVDVDSNTDFEMAFIGILDDDHFVFHGFSKSKKQLVLQVSGVESDAPFYSVTPLNIVTEGADIQVPEADTEPIDFSVSCTAITDFVALESSLTGIGGIFEAGRTLCLTVNDEKYSAKIEETDSVPDALVAVFDIGDEKVIQISLTNWSGEPEKNQLIIGVNFFSSSVIKIDFKSITEEEYVPLDSRFIPSTTSISDASTDTEFPTAKAVWDKVKGGIVYKGTVASESDLPSTPGNGWLYIASASFTLTDGRPIEIDDELFWDEENNTWNIIQGNTDGIVHGPVSSIDGHLAVFDGASGKVIKDGGAIPDVWEIREFSYDNDQTITFYVYKNNELYTGTGFAYLYKNTGLGTMGAGDLTSGQTKRTLTGSHIKNWFQGSLNYFSLLIYDNFGQNHKLFCSQSFYVKHTADSISSNDTGFTTGDQVYNYSEAKANKTTSITAQSTDIQYPSALAVKTYVDNNGFNPSNMPLVTDPVTLDTPQADWNQADSAAPDYIKNKPTIPTVDSPYTINWWFYKTANMLEIKIYKDGVEYTEPVYIKGIGSDGINTTTNGGITSSQISGYYKPALSIIKGDKAFCNVQIFKDSTCSYLMGQFTIVPQGSIADNDGNYVTGDQVYDYVSTQVGNIETLLAQI